jgi:hypothetical protein
MTRVAVLDDWQGVARSSAGWSALFARAEVVFFAESFDDEDDSAPQSCTIGSFKDGGTRSAASSFL